ncbi:hypothetical protein N9R08_01830 [Flavobacteriaceae bacterium]|nr:hypothetical protein [Flavobacteriaceae bacterium]
MAKIEKPKNLFIRLFTLGENFNSRTFSDNTKKFFLNGLTLFIVVTFTFYVENLGEEYETRMKYIDNVKTISAGLESVILYSNEYKETVDWVAEMYQKQYDKWEVDSDSIFLDSSKDSDGVYYYSPMAFFTNRDPFNPPHMGFEIFESGDQDFKLVDPFVTSKISQVSKGIDLTYLIKNTNDVEEKIINQYSEILIKWVRENIDITNIWDNEFWIENRKYIQKDLELKYILQKRTRLWQENVIYQLDEYINIVERDKTILDSVIRIYNQDKYFLYWKVN